MVRNLFDPASSIHVQGAASIAMKLSKHKWFWVTGTLACLAFLLLFMIRLDLFNQLLYRPKALEISSISLPHAKEIHIDGLGQLSPMNACFHD